MWRFLVVTTLLFGLRPASAAALELPPPRSGLPKVIVGMVEGAIQAGTYDRPLCPRREACLLDVGGAVGVRLEWRFPSLVSTGLGLDYGFFDADGLYEVGTLATLRWTTRALFMPLVRYHPLVDVGIGPALFGGNFSVDTVGAVLDLRGGVEIEITSTMAVDLALGARLLGVAPFTASNDDVERGRPFGPSVILGAHLALVLLPKPLRPRPPRYHPDQRDRGRPLR
ncbi:MAG: hypothetical protein GXY23_03875 [Myxococcales bacterium]|nr:hypothetical protein [Myxococcales bacterium]